MAEQPQMGRAEIERRVKEAYNEELQRIQQQLFNAQVVFEFGQNYINSKAIVNGEEARCFGADVSVQGGRPTEVAVRIQSEVSGGVAEVQGHFIELEEPITIKGVFVPLSAEFENPARTLRALAHAVERGEL